jgi:glycerol dehydrogenase-like iron-containing ADH family enzyme
MYSFSLPAQVARYDGALDTVGEVCRPLGQRVLVIGGHTAIEVVRERLLASLARAELTLAGLEWYGGLGQGPRNGCRGDHCRGRWQGH